MQTSKSGTDSTRLREEWGVRGSGWGVRGGINRSAPLARRCVVCALHTLHSHMPGCVLLPLERLQPRYLSVDPVDLLPRFLDLALRRRPRQRPCLLVF